MKKFFGEFKAFAMKGNVLDMAIGVIIGGAFSTIVKSFVDDILMPLLSMILGRIDIAGLTVTIPGFGGGSSIVLAYGVFLQNIINFIIIALCIFLFIKLINKFHAKEEEKEKKEEPSKTEVLLADILDELKKAK